MGTYLNPGYESFLKATKGEIYVDKTGLIEQLNKIIYAEKNCVAVSHARRFGKSQVAGMLDAYYSRGCDSREMFEPFKISKVEGFEEHLNKYNVIHLDIASVEDFHTEDLVEECIRRICDDIEEVYKDEIDLTRDINVVLNNVFKKSKTPFIIIIDEWDCVVRNQSGRQDLVHKYLQFLHCLFKSEESKKFLALGYITGILPIKKIDNESALNNFREYTMLNSKNFAEFFGFTEQEVKDLCEQYDMEFDSVKEWYNGYKINGKHMYNPNSVYQAMVDRELTSYWKNTSAFGTINQFITCNFEGLKEDVLRLLAKGRVSVEVDDFQNDLSEIKSKDDALTALLHLGYLAYDAEWGEAYIPNFEVAKAYQSALKISGWSEVARSISRCEDILKATIRKEEETVAALLELAHEAYSSVYEYNDENSLSCVVTMAYFTAPAYYNVVREMATGKGFADLAFIPRADSGNKPAMIIELKWDKDADTAIRQIKDRRYDGNLKGYGDEILLVGINYDKDTKKHTCEIESMNGR